MRTVCLLVFVTLGSSLGWWLGSSFGIMTAYFVSFIGSLAGVLVGAFINQRYLNL